MKSTFVIITSTLVTLSPTLSLSAFAIYGGKSELFDFICFLSFGATCYALAHLHSFSKGK